MIPYFAVRAWREAWWSVPLRVYYSVIALAVVFAVPLLAYYHLLGIWQ
jgi:hypothetical protein